ncbi:MAG: hypothetical protein KAR40_09855 [Candidatus Sabulitectum sp.]|nr:hypothetical protein [Candidatus Sabulitectum sp.]
MSNKLLAAFQFRIFTRVKFILLLLCFLLPEVAYSSAASTERQSTPEYLLQKADALYWFALEDGGDLSLFEMSAITLDLAEVALVGGELSRTDSIRISNSIIALRTEIIEQIDMTHDTINGVLPLFRYFIARDTLNEWFDEPWVIGAVRGANELIELAITGHLSIFPQIDVCFSSQVNHSNDYESFQSKCSYSEPLENEMIFLFNQSPRFFVHNRSELVEALTEENYSSYRMHGIDSLLADQLCRMWKIDRLLDVRIQELFVESPYWFYIISGKLYSGTTGQLEGTVFTYSMVRDFRQKVFWVPVVIILPLLLAMLICHLAKWKLQRVVPGFLLGISTCIAFIYVLASKIPAGEELLITHWWGIAASALFLLIVVPVLLFVTSSRFGWLGRWLFATDSSSKGTIIGFTAALAGVTGFAALSMFTWQLSVFYVVLAFFALPYSSLRIFDLLHGDRNLGTLSDWVAGLINLGILITILSIMPRVEVTDGVLTVFIVLIIANLISLILLWVKKLRLSLLAIISLFSINSYAIAMTGKWEYLIVIMIPNIIYMYINSFRIEKQSCKGGSKVCSGDGSISWSQIFNNPNTEWPFWENVSSFAKVKTDLLAAVETINHGETAVLLVNGDSGVGKTRMIKELVEKSDIALIHGICQRGDPHSFLEGILEEYTQTIVDGSPDFSGMGGNLVSLLPGFGSLFSLMDDMQISTTLTPNEIAMILLDVVCSTMKGNTTVFLWLDNVEFLTPDGHAIIRALMENACSKQVGFGLILSGHQYNHNVKEIPSSGGYKVSLIGWTSSELIEFLLCSIHANSAAPFLEEAKKSGGLVPVAFFINWLTHLWKVEEIQEIDSKLSAKGELLQTDIPIDVLASAGAVLCDLSLETQRVLEAAACDGTEFNIHCLAKTLELPLHAVLHQLDIAEAKGLVVDLPPDGLFGFKNNLVCEYLLRTMKNPVKGYRQVYYVLHRGLAEAYATPKENQNVVKAAYHARKCGESFHSEALKLCLSASKRSFSLGQWENARDNSSFVLRSSASATEDRIVAGILYLKANWSLKSKPEKLHLEALTDLCNRQNEQCNESSVYEELVLLICEIVRSLWPSAWNTNPDVEIPEIFGCITGEKLSASSRIRLLHFEACTLDKLTKGDRETSLFTALDLLEEALAIETDTIQASQERAEALNTKAEVLLKMRHENTSQIIEAIDESILIKRKNSDFSGLAISYGTLGRFYFNREGASEKDYLAAQKAFEEDLAISELIGDTLGQVVMPSSIASCLLRLEKYREALEFFRLSYKRAEALKHPGNILFAHIGIIRAMLLSRDASLEEECRKLSESDLKIPDHKQGYWEVILKEFLTEVGDLRPDLIDFLGKFSFGNA